MDAAGASPEEKSRMSVDSRRNYYIRDYFHDKCIFNGLWPNSIHLSTALEFWETRRQCFYVIIKWIVIWVGIVWHGLTWNWNLDSLHEMYIPSEDRPINLPLSIIQTYSDGNNRIIFLVSWCNPFRYDVLFTSQQFFNDSYLLDFDSLYKKIIGSWDKLHCNLKAFFIIISSNARKWTEFF